MQSAIRSHLATITPIEAGEARRLMNLRSLLMHNATFLACQTGWIVPCIVGWLFLRLPTDAEQAVGALSIAVAMIWLVCQFLIVFIYPEWPMNRWLSARLRDRIRNRSDRPEWAIDADNRVVELVPRERWNLLALDTATDLMLIRVDSSGVHLEGDCNRYEFPGESILGVELHSIRPTGWFTDTQMVIIYARMEEGPMEFPISYRDHAFGSLRNSRRREQALLLVDNISRIATGGYFGPLTDPDSISAGTAEKRSPDQPEANSHTWAAASASINPYKAPSIVRD